MTDQKPPVDLAEAYRALDPLCEKVGLNRIIDLLEPTSVRAPPVGTALWTSSYAQLLLWPCPSSQTEAVQQSARAGQDWFDEVLLKAEERLNGRPVDGYLVLALPTAPAAEAREDIRQLELSAQVCRKHLIWPEVNIGAAPTEHIWSRVADVTVLGLPDTLRTSGAELLWPEIDSEAQALWNEVATDGASATALRDGAL